MLAALAQEAGPALLASRNLGESVCVLMRFSSHHSPSPFGLRTTMTQAEVNTSSARSRMQLVSDAVLLCLITAQG
jgi:hypothetical protein